MCALRWNRPAAEGGAGWGAQVAASNSAVKKGALSSLIDSSESFAPVVEMLPVDKAGTDATPRPAALWLSDGTGFGESATPRHDARALDCFCVTRTLTHTHMCDARTRTH